MLFAHLKRILKRDRLRLRGLSGARDEFLLVATAAKFAVSGETVVDTRTNHCQNHFAFP
jgi:hypothetical protein